MAPAMNSVHLDHWHQIIENFKFFNRSDATFTIITTKDAEGNPKVVVLRTEDGQRECVMSETGATYEKALEALHVKSADATQNYITANGFELMPFLKRRASKVVDADNESVVSSSSSSTATRNEDEEAWTDETLSDDETVSIASSWAAKGKKAKKSSRKVSQRKRKATKGRKSRSPDSSSRSRSRTRSRSRSRSRSSSHSRSRSPSIIVEHVRRHRQNPGRPSAATGANHPRLGAHPPPPPPPGWSNGHSKLPPTSVRVPIIPGAIPLASGLPPPPPPPVPATQFVPAGGIPVLNYPAPEARVSPPFGAQRPVVTAKPPSPPSSIGTGPLNDVRLHIRWQNHGEAKVLERARASVRNIQDIALAYVRRYPSAFSNVTTLDMAPSRLWSLRASLKSVTVDGEEYNLTSYSVDDLKPLVDTVVKAGGIPRFEIDIEMPVPPPARPIAPRR